MKPIKFEGQNSTYAKDQPQYQPLPALKLDCETGDVISCWNLTFKERLTVLFTGRIWLSLMMFKKPLTPSYLTTKRKELFTLPGDKIPIYVKILDKMCKK